MYSISPLWTSASYKAPNYSQRIKQTQRGPFPSSLGIYDLIRLLMSSCYPFFVVVLKKKPHIKIVEFTFSKSNEKLSAVPRGWSDIHEYLLHVSHTVVLYKHQLIFKTVLCEAISNLLQNWNTSTSTLRDFVHISPTFQMMPSQAKGPDPGSHTVLTCPDWLILMQSGTLPRSFLNF